MWIAWIFAGVSLFCFLGNAPVQRTQEARVLETARQMRGSGWRGWLIPKINGSIRLQKPPLAYWAAAFAYDVTGRVSNAVGRAPTALFGWLMLGATFAIADQHFNRRTAFFSAGCLLSSYLFYRHCRLAETDAPAALFVTLAVWGWWRAVEGGRRSLLLFNIGAVATALAVMFKGGPGAFPPIFLFGLICLRRRWGAFAHLARSGAPFLLAALALPWFLYARQEASAYQFRGEVDTLFSGNDHYAAAWHYLHLVLRAALPWILLVPAALIMAVWPLVLAAGSRLGRRAPKPREYATPSSNGGNGKVSADRRTDGLIAMVSPLVEWADSGPAGVLVWALAIFIPLCLIGNKQFHYLLPLMPPLMILVGWLLDHATREAPRRVAPVLGALVDATLLLMPLLAVPMTLFAGRKLIGHIRPIDWALAGAIAAALAAVAIAYVRRGRLAAVVVYLFAGGLLMPITVGLWMPSTEPDNPTVLAAQIRQRFGSGPYVFFGDNYSLPLCFNLRCAIPVIHKVSELADKLDREPNIVVIAQTKNHHPPPIMPAGLELKMKKAEPGQVYEFYQRGRIRGGLKYRAGSLPQISEARHFATRVRPGNEQLSVTRASRPCALLRNSR